MRTLKTAKKKAMEKAKTINKPVSIALNLGGYYYLFVGNSVPSAYAFIGTVFPDGSEKFE